MGTRNLTMVIDRKGQTKIAQYGQWDGYPSGQGVTILHFIKKQNNLKMLEQILGNTKFYNKCDDINDYLQQYDNRSPQYSNDPDNRTAQDKYWFNNLISRDIGGGILENISNIDVNLLPEEHKKTIYLYDDSEFGKDSLMCEFAYIINLQTNKFIVLSGFNTDKSNEYNLFATNQADVDNACKNISTKYYGCKILKEYSIDNLPSVESFVFELDDLLEKNGR